MRTGGKSIYFCKDGYFLLKVFTVALLICDVHRTLAAFREINPRDENLRRKGRRPKNVDF